MLNNKTLKDNNEICLKCEYQKPIKLQLIKRSIPRLFVDIQTKKIQKLWFFSGWTDSKTKKTVFSKERTSNDKNTMLFWFVIYRPKYPSYVWQLVIQLFKLVPIYKDFCEVCWRAYHGVAWR